MKERVIAAAVVLLGVLALAVSAKLGAPTEALVTGAATLALLSNALKPMFVGEPKTTEEKKP